MIVEQVMSFRYLGIVITAHQDGVFIIWKNQFLKIEVKTRIYKSCLRPICPRNNGRHQQNQEHNPNCRTERITTILRHTGHCKIDETDTARVESTPQQNGRQ